MSKNLNNFLDKLKLESKAYSKVNVLDEQEDKELAKEDALTLIAEFVKDVKKKFEGKQDRIEILKDALKTLEFYINEIQNSSPTQSFDNFEKPVHSFDSVEMDSDSEQEEY